MLPPNFIKSHRLFLYVGFGLIFLALICLPAKVWIVIGPETELLHIGPIFALWAGIWGLPSMLLGIIESFMSRKAVLPWLMLTLCLVNIVLASSVWDAIRFWGGILDRWLISYSPFLIPCVITNIIGILYFVKNEKLTKALKDPKIRIPLLITFVIVSLLIAGGVLYAWLTTY